LFTQMCNKSDKKLIVAICVTVTATIGDESVENSIGSVLQKAVPARG
jgi:hypothetical protein